MNIYNSNGIMPLNNGVEGRGASIPICRWHN